MHDFFVQNFGLPLGGVYGNLIASAIWDIPILFVIYRKLECRKKGCHRIGWHRVGKTHYRTCVKHTTYDDHARLLLEHKQKHPEMHTFLHNQRKDT